ncbi:MAG TPA: adenylate/guanylate cyclase domain-containing protein [Elusimicrobiota bacterium]|nr:adenylate/guanylate cyclase domain-containing protein [Elusimicrobiota bacterium]
MDESSSPRTETRRLLLAIMFSDIVGYSKMMGENERETERLLREHQDLLLPVIKAHGGAVLKFIGDAVLSSYPSATNAVRCAVEIQHVLAQRNELGGQKLEVRIGIHVGDVIQRGGDIFGDGVNVAARIQPLAAPGGICVSQIVHDMIRAQPEVRTRRLGLRSLKNIQGKVEIYQVLVDGAPTIRRPRRTRAVGAVVLAAGLALAGLGARRAWRARAPARKRAPEHFSVLVAPFRGIDERAAKDGRVMKALVEQKLMESFGSSQDVLVVPDEALAPLRSAQEALDAGRRLGAALVIWGEVIGLGDKVQIKPYLTLRDSAFREQSTSALETTLSGGSQLEARAGKASEVAKLAVLAAVRYYRTRDATKAMALAESIQPPTAESLAALGYMYVDRRDWDQADALFRKALALDPRCGWAQNGVGNVQRVRKDYAGAAESFRKAIALEPAEPSGHFNLAQAYEEQGKMQDALGELLKVAVFAPNDALTHRSLGNVYDLMGRFEDSAKEYRISLENSKPDHREAFGHLYYYVELARLGRTREADADIQGYLAQGGDGKWPRVIASFYAGKASEDEVLKEARAVSGNEISTRLTAAYYFLGMRHLLRGREEGAQELKRARERFQSCVDQGLHWLLEYRRSRVELGRMPKI